MIEQPTKLRIYSPVMMDNIDFTAEPELEGKTGSTYRGVAIADGGHAINAADGFPGHLLTVDQAPNSDSFNIEFAMTLIKKINSVVLDGHNLLSVYAASLRDSFKIRHSATDVLGALVENEIRYSGLLGKERPFQRYNGFNSKTVVADDPNLDFGVGNFSWAGEFRTSADTSGGVTVIWVKGSGPQKYQLVMNTSNGLNFAVRDSGAEVSINSNSALNDGGWHRYAVTANRSGLMLMKIDGVLQSDTASCPTGSISNSEDLIFGKADADSNYFDGDQKENIPYNRILAPKETDQMALGVPVPEPFVVGDNSSMNSLGSWININFPTFEASGGVLNIVCDGAFQAGILSPANIPGGAVYKLEVDTVISSGSWRIKDLASNDVVISSIANGTNSNLVLDLTAYSGNRNLKLECTSSSGAATFDNWYVTNTGILVTFPLVIDQWGKQGIVAGSFVVDDTYRIVTVGTTDFTLIGASSNTIGVQFVATGAGAGTGTADRLGAVAAYLPDGISEDQAKLLDGSSNNLHGIMTNVEVINGPAGDVRGFVISEFDEISNHKFWQMAFNEDGDAALLDILIGLVPGCWYRDYEIAAGGFGGRIGFPGVKMNTNESGRDNPEQMFGEKPDWDIGLRVTDDRGIQDLQEFVQTVKGGLFPFWVTFNPSTENNPVAEPIFERVTLVGSVFPWQFKFGQTLPWDVKLKFNRRLD